MPQTLRVAVVPGALCRCLESMGRHLPTQAVKIQLIITYVLGGIAVAGHVPALADISWMNGAFVTIVLLAFINSFTHY